MIKFLPIIVLIFVSLCGETFSQNALPVVDGWRFESRQVERVVTQQGWRVVLLPSEGLTQDFIKYLADRGLTFNGLSDEQRAVFVADAARVGIAAEKPRKKTIEIRPTTVKTKVWQLFPVPVDDTVIRVE